jgi:Coenzyme PQQ synthesis protein D (PqqD)
MTEPDVRYRRSPVAIYRTVGPDVVLARVDFPDVDLLKGTAGLAWQLLDAPSTSLDLAFALAEMYGIPPEAIHGDVGALLDDLRERGWVEVETLATVSPDAG